MQLLSYRSGSETRLGIGDGNRVVDLQRAAQASGNDLPANDMTAFIALGEHGLDMAEQALRSGHGHVQGDVRFAPPVRLRKNVFCIGRNYKAHIEEGFRARGEEPVFPKYLEIFSKPPTTLIGHEDDIRWDPSFTRRLDYEVELGLVIGKAGRRIPADRAAEHIFGYTIGNDVSAREVQMNHGQWFLGKAMDTACPLGPVIVPARDIPNPQKLRLTTRVNGETRQDSNTSDMLYNIARIIEILSTGLTLEVGDVIITGTPSGVASGMTPPQWLKDGDVVECEIEGIGVLRNRVVELRD
ncbi:MAG: fumarylacetoacetate hydrolase family protein [Chloroflexi bacterium]|nr:fumarylacetoacetate hydrolase family protein [Chloroflexota bacterium]